MMIRSEKAVTYHDMGFNCAQSVLAALEDITGLSTETALAIAGGFGGGLRHGGVCGAVSAAIMAIGLTHPFVEKDDDVMKEQIAELTREFNRRFIDQYSTLQCSDLIGVDMGVPQIASAARVTGKLAVCKEIIKTAVDIAEEITTM